MTTSTTIRSCSYIHGVPILEDWSNVLELLLSFDSYFYTNKETALLKRRNKMENILVVIRDEIRENRKVLEEIRDILKSRNNGQSHTNKELNMVRGNDKSR